MKSVVKFILAAILTFTPCAVPLLTASEVSSAQTNKKKQQKRRSTRAKSPRKGKKQSSAGTSAAATSADVRRQQQQNASAIKETRRQITLNTRETERQLNNLQLVQGEITDCNARIGIINQRLDSLGRRSATVKDSIAALDSRLKTMTDVYAKALRKSQGRRNQTSQLAFLLSSESFNQAYRRMSAVRQFGKWRDKKEKEIAVVRDRLQGRRRQLQGLQAQTNKSARQLGSERATLQRKQAVTAQLVDSLKGRRAELDQIVAERQRQAAALDAELDRIIAREAAEARRREEERRAQAEAQERARREAEAREAARKAEAERVAAEKAEAERAAAEKAAAEKAQAEAKERARIQQQALERAKDEEKAAKKRSADEAKAAAEQRRLAEDAAEKARKEELAAAERTRRVKAAAEERARKGVKHTGRNNGRENSGETPYVTPKASGATGAKAPTLRTPASVSESGTAPEKVTAPKGSGFGDCRGKLPMPVAGRYTIVKRFGRQPHPTLPHVETNNAGIDLQTAPAANVRAVYDGEVSAVFKPDGYNTVVVIRHGDYLTVYANLGQIFVSSGQKVKGGQNIGQVFSDPHDSGRSVLHFEVRHGRAKENPESWLRR